MSDQRETTSSESAVAKPTAAQELTVDQWSQGYMKGWPDGYMKGYDQGYMKGKTDGEGT